MTPQDTVSPRPVSRLYPLCPPPHLDLAIVVEGHGVSRDDEAHVVALLLGLIGAPHTSVAPEVALSRSMASQPVAFNP